MMLGMSVCKQAGFAGHKNIIEGSEKAIPKIEINILNGSKENIVKK
jgi:predicted RNA binding protein with dsRBD fold (UPF0201 family)